MKLKKMTVTVINKSSLYDDNEQYSEFTPANNENNNIFINDSFAQKQIFFKIF
jgi:hypothetical protein